MVEELMGRRLVAAERLTWLRRGEREDRRIGAVHLVFDTGHGLILDGKSDWTLDFRVIGRGDDSWLNAYDYELDGGRWQLCDAAGEDQFAAAMNARLSGWEPVYNEVQEVVGMRLSFGEVALSLYLVEGEITT